MTSFFPASMASEGVFRLLTAVAPPSGRMGSGEHQFRHSLHGFRITVAQQQ